jgi:uncharacterized RDD family membrane protein YckC
MFCPNCGHADQLGTFCSNCGADLSGRVVAYSRLWRRAVAQGIDLIATLVLAGAVFLFAAFLGRGSHSLSGVVFIVGIATAVVAYPTLMHGRAAGQTLGKMALRIAVRDANDTSRSIGYPRALARIVSRLAMSVVPLLPFLNILWPLWDSRNQALHDKVVSSVVVRTTPAAAPATTLALTAAMAPPGS